MAIDKNQLDKSRYSEKNLITTLEELEKMTHLPKRPNTIFDPTKEDMESEEACSVIIGGLSLIGAEGYMCPTVTFLMGDEDGLWGWSICLGNPEQENQGIYFFNTKDGTNRGTELPNCMIYFQTRVDESLTREDANMSELDKVINYVIPHISDDGPPPKHPDDQEDQPENQD